MRLWRNLVILILIGLVASEKDDDASSAFIDAARALFADKDAVGGLQGMASAFMQSDAGKQVGDMLAGGGRAKSDGVNQIINGLGSLLSGNQNGGNGIDLSMISNVIESFSASSGSSEKDHHSHKEKQKSDENNGIDFENVLNIASMFLGQNGNSEGIMGLIPMFLENFANGGSDVSGGKKHDHSDHSWYMPPVLENLHLMWDHFSNSELGQTLWKSSGLAKIMKQMTDKNGRIQYEKILESFDNPMLRRRWIKSATNFVADWISHISDPVTQQRYMQTAQFVGNSFLKSQGYPKSVMFEPSRPAESLSRLVNAVAMRHLNMKIDSYKYIKPAVAYIQELMSLASEKGFIVSRINARELSNRLSDTMNNDIMNPILRAYRAYKWGTKMPECASQILCSINEKDKEDEVNKTTMRAKLTTFASFPAAWAISNKVGANLWTLYGAITEPVDCHEKFPADCSVYHEDEIRVTTEYNVSHNEL